MTMSQEVEDAFAEVGKDVKELRFAVHAAATGNLYIHPRSDQTEMRNWTINNGGSVTLTTSPPAGCETDNAVAITSGAATNTKARWSGAGSKWLMPERTTFRITGWFYKTAAVDVKVGVRTEWANGDYGGMVLKSIDVPSVNTWTWVDTHVTVNNGNHNVVSNIIIDYDALAAGNVVYFTELRMDPLIEELPQVLYSRSDMNDYRRTYPEGSIVALRDRRVAFKKVLGSTVIADLPDWEPVLPISPEHFGDLSSDDVPIVKQMLDYLAALPDELVSFDFLEGKTYTFNSLVSGTNYCFLWQQNKSIRINFKGTVVAGPAASGITPTSQYSMFRIQTNQSYKVADGSNIYLIKPKLSCTIDGFGTGKVDATNLPVGKVPGFDVFNIGSRYRDVTFQGMFVDQAPVAWEDDVSSGTVGQGSGDSALFVKECDHLTIRNNVFWGSPDCAIYLSGDPDGASSGTPNPGRRPGEDALIEGNEFWRCWNAIKAARYFRFTQVKSNVITECNNGFFTGLVGYEGGGGIDPLSSGWSGVFEGNILRRIRGNPFVSKYSDFWTVTGNVILDYRHEFGTANQLHNGAGGANFQEVSGTNLGGGIVIYGSRNCTVTGNVVGFEKWNPITSGNAGYFTYGVVSAQFVEGATTRKPQYNTITGNSFYRVTGAYYFDSQTEYTKYDKSNVVNIEAVGSINAGVNNECDVLAAVFTPTLGDGAGNLAAQDPANVMRYTVIGRVMHFEGLIAITGKGSTSSGSAVRINGFPLPKNGPVHALIPIMTQRAYTAPADKPVLYLQVNSGQTYGTLVHVGPAGFESVTWAQLATNAAFRITGSYHIGG